MKISRSLRIVSVIFIVVMLLVACSSGGGSTNGSTDNGENTSSSTGNDENTSASASTSGDGGSAEEKVPDTPTATPEPTIPDILVVHPEATDIEITEATDTYVYIIPGMVAEAEEYFQKELTARGWELLGNPTVMGHLATINMQREDYRLTVSLQDNEHSMTTRVQMLLIEQ